MQLSALAGPLALLGLVACSAGPESYASMTNGVGFGDYQRYLHERDSTRTSAAPYSVPPQSPATPILPPRSMPAAAPTTLDIVPVRSLPPPIATPLVPAPITSQPLAPIAAAPLPAPMRIAATPSPMPAVPQTTTHSVQAGASFGTTPAFDPGPSVRPGISDEQDFQAVSARETIASDRERLAQHRAQYQVIEVSSVPPPSEHGGANITAFALSVSHAPGTEVYRRLNPLRWSRWENACLQYRNQDAAQEAFLANGGPQRDGDNLDPDGDGYACWWDPTPLRQALASR